MTVLPRVLVCPSVGGCNDGSDTSESKSVFPHINLKAGFSSGLLLGRYQISNSAVGPPDCILIVPLNMIDRVNQCLMRL